MLDILPDARPVGGVATFSPSLAGLSRQMLHDIPALIVSKRHAGFSEADVSMLTPLIGAIACGERRDVKFLVYDFAQDGAESAQAPDGFEQLTAANAELVVDAPVITVAWARGAMSGRDLEFAMSCAIIVAERGARFSFCGDAFELFGVYAAIARKIGFVRTERLIETEASCSAQDMHDLMIVKDVVEPQAGFSGIESYLAQIDRRYNASQAIYRAQRMAESRLPGGGALRHAVGA